MLIIDPFNYTPNLTQHVLRVSNCTLFSKLIIRINRQRDQNLMSHLTLTPAQILFLVHGSVQIANTDRAHQAYGTKVLLRQIVANGSVKLTASIA